MDVEQRSGQLYNSEISASFIGPSISNNRHMNQFINSKSKLHKQKKLNKSQTKLSRRTPTFDVLPKIETNKSTSPEIMTSINHQKSQTSNNNSFTLSDTFQIDPPNSETISTKNVQQWLQMPTKMDNLANNTVQQQYTNLSTVSSEDMLTRVGESTDRTSVTSSEWGDDVCEFDKKESHRVNQMFEEIDRMLYQDTESNYSVHSGSTRASQSSSFSDRIGIHSGPVHLRRECSEWTHQFPHFRLLGQQVSLPQEQGFMFHESDRSGSITPKNSPRIIISDSSMNSECIISKSNTDASDIDRISLIGNSIKLDRINEYDSKNEEDFLSSQEEVFATDGEIVEIIAIDYKMDDEDFCIVNNKKSHSHNSLFRSHKGFPPITPNAVMRDAVLTAVFDNLWSQVVEWILPLLSKMYQSYSSRDMLNLELPDSSQSLNMTMSDMFRNQKTSSHLLSTSISNLDDILKISSKTLQFREKSYLRSIPEETKNPSSSIKGFVNGPVGVTRNPFAYLRKHSKAVSNFDRSQTPLSHQESSFILDKEYKGSSLFNHSKLSTGSEHLSPLKCVRGKALYNCSSPDMISKSGTLPPINLTSHHRLTVSRIASAQIGNIHNQSIFNGNSSIASHILLTSESLNTRPCTSQTARSDLVGGIRSSTPNGGRKLLNLNVHGSSITTNSYSIKTTDELSYENFRHSKSRPYWKTYNNPVPATTNKRNKSVSNSIK